MRIGLSTSVIQRGKTGIAQYVFALLRAFQKSEMDFRFSLFVLEEDASFFSQLDERFQIVQVPETFRPALKNILWHQTVLPRLCRKLSLDLLHIPSYRRLVQSTVCPTVATIHDLAPFRVSRKYDLARMFYGRIVVKHLAKRQTGIIAVSENTARDIETFFGISSRRLRVIHNGLDHERFYPRDPQISREFVARRLGSRKPFVLYVARLEHPGKNHVRLIDAFERFKHETGSDWALVLGGSDWQGADVIHRRIANSPYRAEISALGFVPDDELPVLYSAAEAFVYPSLYEGFGFPPLEAMACHCPVICSGRGSLAEVVSDGAAVIEPESIASISEALVKLHADPLWRTSLVRRGKARARAFSWERTASETLSLYQRVCRKPITASEKPFPTFATR
jgi:glycosyltransferase involved in cell wall biosynthesis